MNVSFLQDLLNSVAEQGRQYLPWALGEEEDLLTLAKARGIPLKPGDLVG